ncbi:MAG: hypothetical protein AAGA66_13035, partial [Bacteroidota bacterium]
WYWRMHRVGSGDLNESLLFSSKRGSGSAEDAKMVLRENGELSIAGIKTGGLNEWYWKIYRQGSGDLNESLIFASRRRITDTDQIKMVLKESGNLGLGTTTPTHKLEVNGTIRAKEIRCEAAPWPDYVFEESYELPSIESVESFIKSKGHLPEMPTAEEVAAEGVALGEMNRLLLQKVEELTLYTIEQEKRLKKQEALEKQVEALLKRVSQLESK